MAVVGLAFLNALYGGFGAASWVSAGALALALLVLGIGYVAACVIQRRWRLHPAATGVALAGVALHAWQAIHADGAPSWILFFWSVLPYLAGVLLGGNPALRWPATGVLLAGLFLDLRVHWLVFVHPTHSTAALALLFAPVLILCVGMPVVMGTAFAVQSWRGTRSSRTGQAPAETAKNTGSHRPFEEERTR